MFVFGATHERVFSGDREQRRRHLAYYVGYQVALVGTMSALLVLLLRLTGLDPVLGKVAVTPVTVVCNFLALSRIARMGGPQRSASPGRPVPARDGAATTGAASTDR